MLDLGREATATPLTSAADPSAQVRSTCAPRESLLVVSDVHLGSDLNDSGPSVSRSRAIDADLASLLSWYRAHPPPADRWRLVVAGDFFDLVGMAVDPRPHDPLDAPLTEDEKRFGLWGAEEHVRLKLRRIAERHEDVIAALGAFVASGNTVTFLHGNHDLELYWDSAKAELRSILHRASATDETREVFDARIDFCPWFFHREGLVYIEHGHQYDPFCSVPFVTTPRSAFEPMRVTPTLSDLLLRYIVRRTRGIKEYGHEDRGLTSYVSWGLGLGFRQTVDLIARFIGAVSTLWKMSVAFATESGDAIRDEHARRRAAIAAARGIDESRLVALENLAPGPVGATPAGVLASVMLDRAGTTLVMVASLAIVALSASALEGAAIYIVVLLLVFWVLVDAYFSKMRGSVDPGALMVKRSVDIARLFPAPFVVMGHTHVALTKEVAPATTYLNVGSWAEEEPEPGADLARVYRASRTHAVIHDHGGTREAKLCAWAGDAPVEKTTAVYAGGTVAAPKAVRSPRRAQRTTSALSEELSAAE